MKARPPRTISRALPILAAILIAAAPARAAEPDPVEAGRPIDRGETAADGIGTAKPARSGPTVHPLPLNGAELARGLALCQEAGIDATRIADYRACNGYVAGILVGASAMASLAGTSTPFCLPDGVGDRAIQDAIIAYVAENTEAASSPVPATVIAALVETWPCR
jgi:hypothetical protein